MTPAQTKLGCGAGGRWTWADVPSGLSFDYFSLPICFLLEKVVQEHEFPAEIICHSFCLFPACCRYQSWAVTLLLFRKSLWSLPAGLGWAGLEKVHGEGTDLGGIPAPRALPHLWGLTWPGLVNPPRLECSEKSLQWPLT